MAAEHSRHRPVWELSAYVRSAGKFEKGHSKLYAVDPSLVAACAIPVFGTGDVELLGRQVETAVAQALRCFCETVEARLTVYQHKSKAESGDGEVDFVVEIGDRVCAIEVTSKNDRKKVAKLTRLARELRASFVAIVSMRGRQEVIVVDEQPVLLLPLHELLLKLATARGVWPW